MNIVEFIQDLAVQGITLREANGRLRCQGPKERITPTLLAQLKQHKEMLLTWLQQRQDSQGPLSYSQKAYWQACQLEPDSAEGNVSVLAELEPELNLAALEQAFQYVLKRHSILRTTYDNRSDGTPYAQVHEQLDVSVQIVNTIGWSAGRLQEQIEADSSLPFDLRQSPIRATVLFSGSPFTTVLRHGEPQMIQSPLLIVVVHHIAIDGLAFSVLLNDLCTCYAARKNANQPGLPILPLEYRDFVRWEEDQWQAQQTKLTAYWHQQLRGPLPTIHWPTDSLHSQPPIDHGNSYDFDLSPTLTQRLKQLAQSQKVTFYTTLLTAFAVLIQRYTNQTNLLVMMPVSRRELTEFASVIGDFSDQVIVRLSLSERPTFASLLAHTQAVVQETLQHQGYPFSLLVEQQDVFDANRTSLSKLCFAFAPPLVSLPQDGLITKILDYCKVSTKGTDLLLFMTEREDAASGYFIYNLGLFSSTTIEQLVTDFQALLSSMVANPQAECLSCQP